MLIEENNSSSALRIQEGIEPPPQVNTEYLKKAVKRKPVQSPAYYIEGILSGNRTILSQAITLVESALETHQVIAQSIIEGCLPHSGKSIRIGITGVPGVGKSTFIESFGMHLISCQHQVAVLAIDPSSQRSKGSILGDKTRMEKLSVHPKAYIRPSPSAGSLGGVARKTRETVILCEAAGHDVIIIETVGVGQSETAVHSMVDFFLLLMLAGAGDELQGIKRGIMEMADTIVITKADGNNTRKAELARVEYRNALHLFPPSPSKWTPRVMTCSSRERKGIAEIWETIRDYVSVTKSNGWFWERRREQAVTRMHETIIDTLKQSFYTHPEVSQLLPDLERQLREGETTSYKPASILLDKYFSRSTE